jgi:hypothetical protein
MTYIENANKYRKLRSRLMREVQPHDAEQERRRALGFFAYSAIIALFERLATEYAELPLDDCFAVLGFEEKAEKEVNALCVRTMRDIEQAWHDPREMPSYL